MLESVLKINDLNLSGECLGRYCHNHRLSFIASILLSLFLAVALWEHVSHTPLFFWLTLVLLAQGWQAWYSRRCLTLSQEDFAQVQAWMPGLMTGSIVTGLCWGSSLFFMDVAGLGPVAIMLIFALAGITAYAGIAKADLFISAIGFEVAALLPLGIWLFMQDGEISRFLGIITLLYLGLLYFLLRQLNEMTTQSRTLRGHNEELAAALAREQTLEREGAMFRNMFETITDPAVVVHDPRDNNRIVYANDAACRHFGTDRETLRSWSPRDFDTRITPEKGKVLNEALQMHGRFAFQSAHRRADGEEVPVEVVINMFRHEGTELMVTFIRNITKRLAAEERMRELEFAAVRQEGDQRMGRFLECVPGLFFTLRRDRDGVMSMPFARGSSPSFQGLSPEVVAESIESLLALCHPDDVDPLLAELHASAQEMRPCHAEFRIGDPSQRQMVMELTAQPLRGAEPGVMEWHGFMQDITARKKMEGLLRMKEHALDHSSEAMFLVGDQGRFVYVNEQACRSLGYSRDELLAMSVIDIDPDFSLPLLQGRAERVLNESGSFVFETRHQRRDGSMFPVEILMSELEYNDQVLGMALARDITERKRVERALQQSEMKFRTLYDSTGDAVMLLDEQGFFDCNASALKIFGCATREEFCTKHPADLSPAEQPGGTDSMTLANQHIAKAMQEGSHRFEWMHRNAASNENFPAEVLLSSMVLEGKPVLQATVRDITERKRMEEALDKRAQEFRSLAESAPDNIIRYDLEGRCRYLNERLLRQLGLASMDETIGKRPGEVWPDGRFAALEEAAARVVASGERAELEVTEPDGNGGWQYHLISVVAERNEQGEIVGSIAFGRNITHLRRTERLMQMIGDHLPGAVTQYRLRSDLSGELLYASQGLQELYGVTREMLADGLGPMIALIHPDDLPKAVAEQEHAAKTLTTAVSEFRINHPAKGERWVQQITTPVPESEDSLLWYSLMFDITERKRLEVALGAREAEFRSLAENSPDAIFRYNKDCRRIYVNQTVERLTGKSREELLGKSPIEFTPVPSVDAIKNQRCIKEVLEGGKPVELEMLFTAADGRQVAVHNVFVPEFAADGSVQGVLCMGRDVTERKKTEEALQQSEQLMRTVIDATPDWIFIKDQEHRYRLVNQGYAAALRMAPEDFIGKNDLELGFPEELVKGNPEKGIRGFWADDRLVLDSNESQIYPDDPATIDGEIHTFHTFKTPLRDAGGKPWGVLAFCRDISERKKMEQALAERQAFLDSLFEAIPVPVFSKDCEGRYLKINRAFEQYYGADRNQMIGKSVFDTHPRELAETYHAKDVEVFERRVELQQYEYQIKHSDGTLRDVLFSKSAFADSQGEVKGLIGAVMDITERKRAEAELQRRFDEIHQLNDRLESHARLLEEQTVEMEAAQEQLKQTESWYRGILHSAPDGMMVVDERGHITQVNAEMERMFGYGHGELAGQTMEVLLPADMRAAHVGMRNGFIGNAVRTEVPLLASNLRACRKDGSEFVVDVTLARLPENDYNAGAICAAVRDVTERQQAENELRQRFDEIHQLNDRLESHARLLEEQTVELEASQSQLKQSLEFSQGIINAVPDILFEVDRDGRYLNFWWNAPEATESLKTVMLGKTVHEMLPKEVADQALAAIREAEATGRSHGLTIPIMQANGEIRWYEHSIARKHGDTPADTTFIALSRDVTERRKTELAIADTRNKLKSVLQTIPDLVWLKDAEGVYLACNPAFERFFGASEAEIVGKTDHDFVDAELADFFRQKDLDAIKAGTVSMNEEWVTYAEDGRRGLLETRKVPVFDAGGRVIGVLGVARDITERKLMEQELHRREQEFRTLVDNLPDPFFRYDRNHRRTYVNAKVEQLTGKSAESLLGLSVAESKLALPEWNALLDHEIERVLETGQPATSTMEYQTPGGQTRHFDCWLGPLFGNDGTPDSVMLYMRDITEIKASELKYKQALELSEGIINAIPDLLFELDGEGRYLNIWAQNPELLAASREALLGRTVSEKLPPKAAEICMDAVREAGECGLSLGKIICIDLPHGPGWFELSVSRKPGNTPSSWHFLVMSRDITERKKMEETLTQREHEFRTLVENAADTVARYGKDMRRLYANPAFAKLVEGGQEALLGKKPSEVPGGAHAEVYEEKMAEVLANGVESEFELTWHDRTGRELCTLISMTPEFGKDGEVESVLAVGRDISELHMFRQKIHQMAFYDALTSLPNRALFNDRLRQMIADASWHHQLAGVMMIDMDRFKAVNDTMGHAVGDELLRETGARLNACVRAYDTVARLGGDEFAVLLPEVRTAEDLGHIADKMRSVFDAPFILDGKEVFISCSIGIALYPNDSSDADDLLKYADSAMYYAKRTGRNNFRFYSRDLTESANERLMLESDLRRATERGELELYYQPKVSLVDGCMIGSEALLRWKHPTHGMIPPDKFIPVAEDSGLILEIGEWVLRDACRAACEFNGENKSLHKVAINLSARQFLSNDLVATVCEVLDETSCRPEWIELEITESLLLDEDGDVLGTLKAFRALGITIAIDDFGTGYSALSYLARFPISTLKVDRSFVRSIETDTFRAELVKAILSIAHCLGQQVVAEGVETPGQAVFLQAHGCHVAQGYLFSKPVAKGEFMKLPGRFEV